MKNLEVLSSELKEDETTTIRFISQENISINDKVSIVFDNLEHYFDVKLVRANNKENFLYIEAMEVGYKDNYFNKLKNFDLRQILELKIDIITDKDKIKQINCHTHLW